MTLFEQMVQSAQKRQFDTTASHLHSIVMSEHNYCVFEKIKINRI